MIKELTNSNIERQNILNNNYALDEIQKASKIRGVMFENRFRFTKEMTAEFFDVDIRTIERYLENKAEELKQNGYEILKGKKLKDFFAAYAKEFDADINVGSKIRQKTSHTMLHQEQLMRFCCIKLSNLSLMENSKVKKLN